MDIPSERLIRMSCEWLARHNRVVMEVSINRLARQPEPQTPTLSNAPGATVRAVLTGTPSSQAAVSPSPSTYESGETRDGYCPRCKFRRINSVCTNSRCKGCCFQEGTWACSVHKKDGPIRPDSNPAPAVVTPNAIAQAGIASQQRASSSSTVPQVLPGHVPCAFCNRNVPMHGLQLAIHIQQCRPNFFEQFPQARKLSVPGLHHFVWNNVRPGYPVPPIASTAPATPAVAQPAPSTTIPKADPIRPGTAGFAPSEIARAMAWEQSVKELPDEIEAILPAPIMRNRSSSPGVDVRVPEDRFESMCAEACRDPDATRRDAHQRYDEIINNLSLVFGPEPKPAANHDDPDRVGQHKKRTRQLHQICKATLLYRRSREHEMILRDRLEFESNLAREKESGERSFGLLQQLRIVQNPAQLKTVAGRFTMHHWLGWRARMPSHVQRRSRLPSSDRADLSRPLKFSKLELIEPKRS